MPNDAKQFLVGVYTDEDQIIAVTKAATDAGLPVHDTFTPYAVHGLDAAQKLPRSKLTFVCGAGGALGFCTSFFLQTYTQGIETPFLSGWPIDVGGKPVSARMARAEAIVSLQPQTLVMVRDRRMSKGDVLEVARLAGIMATKRTDELIPLCHSLGLDSATIDFEYLGDTRIRIESKVQVQGRTGVEMEAMTAVSIAALTIYDMCKAVDRTIQIEGIRLLEKSGGKSGHFIADRDRRA